MATLYVIPAKQDRTVALSEADELHPGGEAWIVGYPGEDPQPVEVGDTPLVRQQIARGALIQVDGPARAARTGAPSGKTDDKKPPA
jgi:hypothetical protein